MKHILFALILASSFVFSAQAEVPFQDPFKNITFHKFKNGLKVVLAPDPKSEFVQIKVNVGVGFVHETEANYGVSHLLEHMLFRNTKLKDDMSYLQIIKEKDGSANGTTSWDRTNYYATVRQKDGPWIVNILHEMIMKPSMSAKHVETEKKTVLLEIGQPSPIEKAIGFDVFKTFSPGYLDDKDFWEEYFNVKIKSNYSNLEEQLSTLKLTKKQVEAHYKKYYDPSNMQIYVSGNFNSTTILNQLIELWSGYPTKNIGNQRMKYDSQAPTKPHLKYGIASATPRITLGYLVDKVSVREKEVLLSYTDYLSHRLMKKLRNVHGETYTAHDRSSFKQDFGFFAITLQSSDEKFDLNLSTVRKMLKDEVVSGKLTDEEINEAKRLYLNNFVMWSNSTNGRTKMGERMFEMNELTGLWETPFEILETVTPEQYRLILKKYANDNMKYEVISHPELFFFKDTFVLAIITCIASFIFFRRFLQKPFKNDHVRWVRKVKFTPLKTVEMAVGGLVFLACLHTYLLLSKLTSTSAFESLGLIGEYIQIPFWIIGTIATAQAVISFFPRKIYIMDDKLVIKSLSYYSRQIPKSQIQSIKAISVFEVMGTPRMWLSLWNSFHFYDIKFWKKGLMIELKNGKLFFFSTKDSIACVGELKGLLSKDKPVAVEEKEAA